MSWIEDVIQARSAIRLVIDAEVRTQQALDRIPPIAEQRRLNSKKIELGLAKSALKSRIDAILRSRTPIINPSAEQNNRIKKLTMEVQNQTNTTMAASMTLEFAGRVLDLANELVA